MDWYDVRNVMVLKHLFQGDYPDAFIKFIRKNPHIMKLFYRFAKEAKDAGHKTYSHWLIVNRIRWETDISIRYTSPWKISNNNIRHMAKLLISMFPEFDGFFIFKTVSTQGDSLCSQDLKKGHFSQSSLEGFA